MSRPSGPLCIALWRTALLACLVGCDPALVCESHGECGDGFCINGRCAAAGDAGMDAGPPPLDAGPDAGRPRDAGADAGQRDAGLPTDAGPICGDGQCQPSEDPDSCAEDCICGDDRCQAPQEDRESCAADCGPSFDRIDWLIQDRVQDDPALDPYCAPHSRRIEQLAYTPIHFVRLDQDLRQNFTSFRVRVFRDQARWTNRALTLFDQPPYFEMQRLSTGGLATWGGDVMESQGPLVSIVGTNDAGGLTGWFNNTGPNACAYSDAWVLYDETDVPVSDGPRAVNWSSELQSRIRSVTDPAVDNCPTATGTARTRWTYFPSFEYASAAACTREAHKRMDTIVSDHGAADLSHHEVFYLTDEYGLTRWERWNCSRTREMAPPSPDYAARRCNYAESESVMHMSYPVPEAPEQGWQIQNREGLYCVLVDCRDATEVVAWEDPAGWIPAGWAPGAQAYFAGNLLENSDFTWSDTGPLDTPWTQQGTMQAETIINAADNHTAVLQTTDAGRGWLSQTASAQPLFDSLGAGASTAGPLRVRFGVRARTLESSPRTMQLVLVQWNEALTDTVDVEIQSVEVTPEFQHFAAEVALAPEAGHVQIRLSLDATPGSEVEVDDAYALLADAP